MEWMFWTVLGATNLNRLQIHDTHLYKRSQDYSHLTKLQLILCPTSCLFLQVVTVPAACLEVPLQGSPYIPYWTHSVHSSPDFM